MFFLVLLFPLCSFPMGHRAVYDVRFMFFKVGSVVYTLKKQGEFYSVDITAKALGIAGMVSGGRVEKHHVLLREDPKGLLRPVRYIYDVKKKGKRRVKYLFFMDDGTLKVFDDKWRGGRFKRRKRKVLKVSPGCLDPVSLYEDIHRGFVFDPEKKGPFSICVVTPKGKVERIKGRSMGRDEKGFLAVVTLHSGILPFKAGNIQLHFSKDKVIDRAHMENVAFFGDLNVELVSWESL